MQTKKINVLQFICPVGFYGAERWITALANNSNRESICHHLAVTEESDSQNLEIVNQFPKDAGQTFKIPMRSRFDISVIKKLVEIIEQHEIDIIHTHGYKSDILGIIAAKKAGIKSVSTPHGFGIPNDFKLKMFVKFGTWSLRFFDAVVPLSTQLKDEVIGFGVSRNKIQYVQNGVDLREIEPFRLRRSQREPSDIKRIGFVGQMIPRKNVKDILDVFEQVSEKVPSAVLELLGDGSSREELERQAETLKSRSKISFLGFRNDRMEFLTNFDLFVMSSRDEGIPRCLMEAMGMEIPVSAYNIKGIDQLVTHNHSGLLSDFGDKQAMVQDWVRLLTDGDLATRLTQEGRRFVDDNFSAKRMATEYEELFGKLLKGQFTGLNI